MIAPAALARVASSAIAPISMAAFAQVAELRPVDEAATRADFFTFRAHLHMAVARRDVDAVLAVVHPKISLAC